MREALAAGGHEVTVVAPDREQSAASHSITLDRPLRIRRLENGLYTVDGTPTDCVLVGCHGVLRGNPDLVVSGVNHGPNMGEDVTYSGTVAAAFEAHILGIPAIAASMAAAEDGDFAGASAFVEKLARRLERAARSRPLILNVNFPPGKAQEWERPRVTCLGTRAYSDEIIEKEDPRGRKYYWIGGSQPAWEGDDDCDFAAVAAGAVSVTPLDLDLTNHGARAELAAWDLAEVLR